jgi:cell division septation protein DedD
MTDSIDKKSNEKPDNLEVDLDVESDEAKSSVVLKNQFQDDDDAIERLLMNSDFDADDEPGQSDVDEVGVLKELTDFSDFSDLNEADEVGDFFGLADDLGASKLRQDDECDVEATAPAVADLIVPNVEQQIVIEESDGGGDAGASEQLDDFSDLSDFNEPEMVRLDSPRMAALETQKSEQATENLSAHVDDVDLADEADDFIGLRDDFDESDMILDDNVETNADLIGQSFDDKAAIDSLVPDAGFDFEDALENVGGKQGQLLDDFDESDMIQDEVDDWANLVAPGKEPQTVDEEPVNDLQDIARDGVYAASQSGTGAVDENNFDSLLLDAGFDSEDPLAQLVGKKDDFGNDVDSIETDDFFQLDELSDDLSRQTEEVQLAETEILSTQDDQDDQDDDFLLPDFDITADTEISDVDSEEDPFGDVDFLNEDEAVVVFGSEVEEPKLDSNEAVIEPVPQQASATDTDINAIKDLKKQLVDAENKLKKTKLLSYVAAGFGAVVLLAAIGFGVMTFSAKTEVSNLTETVSTLEASLARSAANNPNAEIDAMRDSVVQLNQQVDGFITELKGNPLFPVDLLNDKVPNLVAKQDMVSKSLDMLQVKMGGLEEKSSSRIPVAESPKVEVVNVPAPAQENKTHQIAPVKIETAHEPVKEGVVHEHAPTLEKAGHEKAPVKVEVGSETAPAKVKAQPKVVVVKPIVPPKAVPKQEPVKIKIQTAPGKWAINLGAFKQEWYAKSKVAEFAQQGVVAEVIPVHEKNTTLYRLRVGGFKSKAEADSNKARIKRALNLDSVWVSDN